MIQRRSWRAAIIAALLLTYAVAGCAGGDHERRAVLGAIVDGAVVPGHERFRDAALRLEQASARLAETPTEDAVANARSAWLEAALAWKAVELFEFDGLLLVHNAIEKRPPRAAFIEEAVASVAADDANPDDPAFVEALGSTTKGLAAMEYLLFPTDARALSEAAGAGPTAAGSSAELQDTARRRFLEALARNLAEKSAELVRFWGPAGGGYGDEFRANASEGADTRSSISMLANNMIELCEVLVQVRLGRPVGRTTDGDPRPSEVESPRSGHSLELLAASVGSLEAVLEAGLGDYLDHVEGGAAEDALSRRIERRIAATKSALASVEGPLSMAVLEDLAGVGVAYEELRDLLVLLKVDMAAQLGITVTFGDADGD